MALVFSFLFERAAQDGQRGTIFLAGQFLLERDERLKIENANAEAFANVHLGGVWEQFPVSKIAPDGPEKVQRSIARNQIQMAG